MTDHQSVAVLGATGFVGRAVVRALLAKGHAVKALARDREKARAALPNDKNLTIVTGHALDPAAVATLLTGATAAINLIGIIRPAPGNQTFSRMHVEVPKLLIDVARAQGLRRLIHMSAIGVKPDGHAEYQRTKFEGEQLVRRSGLDWTVFRPGLIHGPDGELVAMIKGFTSGSKQPFFFIPYFTRHVEHDEGVSLGRITFEPSMVAPVAVDDVAACFAAALDKPATIGEVYNLVGTEELNFRQLMEWFRDNLPRADRTLPALGIPGLAAAYQARAATAIGLGGLLPFHEGQAWMAMEDTTASLDKVTAHLGIKPQPFRAAAQRYVASLV